ncbi:type II secretion system protein [Virgibacillus proomii]|uniref:type II secretion system protein n=1 Tax=Virgibacillus proomii TaxID=84407 RepID=UPI001C10CEB0|nr:type II secretion system protein [Virgibacillus proomii]MBU5265690.1 type II secretion system GspH family protein [Virgibacillus proomii]
MLKKWKQKLKLDQRGLTLVELLAVVVILAIVAAIAFIVISNVIENSKKDSHVANAQQIISAAKMHESTGGNIGENGVTLDDLKKEGFIEKEILDPWNDKNTDYGKGVIVTRSSGEKYYINNFDGKNCKLTNKSEADLNGGRKACN